MKKILAFTVFVAALVMLLAAFLRQLKLPLLAVFPSWPCWARWVFELPETPPLGPYHLDNSWPMLGGILGGALALLLKHLAKHSEGKGGGDEI